MVIFVPLTLGTLGTLNFRHLTRTPGDGNVTLSWNSASDAAGYNVYRSTTSGSGFAKINTQLVTETTYKDTGVTNGIHYSHFLGFIEIPYQSFA